MEHTVTLTVPQMFQMLGGAAALISFGLGTRWILRRSALAGLPELRYVLGWVLTALGVVLGVLTIGIGVHHVLGGSTEAYAHLGNLGGWLAGGLVCAAALVAAGLTSYYAT